jgi:membrane associated rhomboid family serine protease
MAAPRRRGGGSFGGWLGRVPPITLRLVIATLVATLLCIIAANAGAPDVLSAFLLQPEEVIHRFKVWKLLSYLFVQGGDPIGFLFGLLVLYFFGSWFERRWGPKRFLTFFLASGAGAGALVVLAGLLSERVSQFPYSGNWAAIEALTVAMGLGEPDAEIYLYMLFPVKARTLMFGSWVLLGLFMVFAGTPVPYLNAMGGVVMGLALTVGSGGARKIWLRFQVSRIERSVRRRARHLKVVPPAERPSEDSGKKTYLH